MEGKRFGFTTGSCAAAASKAAAYMLLLGKTKDRIIIDTPKGIPFQAEILDITREEKAVACAVKKDGGDDPDVTSGALVYSKVFLVEESEGYKAVAKIIIDGGVGIGRVTKPGLDQPVGNAAINHVPRQMIEKEVREVCDLADFHGMLKVEIFMPEGKAIAEKTFNPRLGIEGGLSILGTTGIVEPMSEKALLDTILVELKQHRALGEENIAIAPGNYGQEYMKRTYGFDLDKSVKCSNFIGDTIDMAADCGFKSLLLTGHIGKLIKLYGGIMNTHSKMGDCRMELLASAVLRSGMDAEYAKEILECVTTEAALEVFFDNPKFNEVMKELMDKISLFLNKRAAGRIHIECIIYSNEFGGLISTVGAEKLLREIQKEMK
ncbi:MAG: cobalamin biosynthesis protein CbiD [Pseudobutyrivibrio sp.]|nr:cobalamin biosynthesis protein CbiD [Pseudobutyrivibrio sp.]